MKKFLVLLTVLSSLLLVSCQNAIGIIEESFTEDKTKNTLSIFVNSTGEGISFNKKARMITPNALYSDDLDFYLWGKNETTKTTLERTQVSFEAYNGSSTTGALDIYLAPGVYELTLVAIKKGTSYNQSTILYSAYAQTDLRYNNNVYFYLSSENLNSNGYAKLALYTVGWQVKDNYSITAGIYEISNENTCICKVTPFNLKDYYYPTASDIPEDPTYNFDCSTIGSGTAIPSGIYNFTVTINDGYRNYYYTDRIQIHGDRTTCGEISLPDIVDKIPEPPTYLIAQYQIPDNSQEQFYNVEFCWDDNSITESNFQLEFLMIDDYLETNYSSYLTTLTDSTESVANKNSAWNKLYTAENTYCSDKPFTVDTNLYDIPSVSQYLGGSLSKNSTYCVYNLLLGKRYFARICAASDAGKSEYVYLDLNNTNNKPFETTANCSSPKKWTSNNKFINLYKVVYELNGGSFINDSTSINVTSLVKKYDFYTQTETGEKLLSPISYEYSSGNFATLKSSSNQFENWKDSISGQIFDSTQNYTSYKNLVLYANYNLPTENIYKLISNNNILLGASENNLCGEAIANSITLNSFNSATVSLANTKYLFLIVKNAYSDDSLNSGNTIYDSIFSSVDFTVSEQGNTAFMKNENSNEETYAPYRYNYSSLNLTDSTKFQVGKTYNVTYNCYANSEHYSTTIIFTITE